MLDKYFLDNIEGFYRYKSIWYAKKDENTYLCMENELVLLKKHIDNVLIEFKRLENLN